MSQEIFLSVEMFNPSGISSWVVARDLVVGYEFNFYVVPNLFSFLLTGICLSQTVISHRPFKCFFSHSPSPTHRILFRNKLDTLMLCSALSFILIFSLYLSFYCALGNALEFPKTTVSLAQSNLLIKPSHEISHCLIGLLFLEVPRGSPPS